MDDIIKRVEGLAKKQLLDSGLFTEEDVERAVIDTYRCEDGNVRTGMTPLQAGDLIGVNGKSIQGACHSGKVESYWTHNHYMRLIPIEEIIRLKQKRG